MREQELRKREARLTARETWLMRRERDVASREAELSVGMVEDAEALAVPDAPRTPMRERLAGPLQVALGLWLMVAPLALGYGSEDPRGGTVACGAALALLGLYRLATVGTMHAHVAPALWLSACVATTLVAVATLADKTIVAAVDDAVGGVAAWVALVAAWPRPYA
jgi:hypothetical protein